MPAVQWNPEQVKALLRQTSQTLGQLQAKKDSQTNITRKDIATLLQHGNVGLAREKAQNLMREDAYGDLLEELEMQMGTILSHFTELERNISSPLIVEALSSIIFAAPHARSKELDAIRSILIQRVGPDFARSASHNKDNHVSQRILAAVSYSTPSAPQLDGYLKQIAQSYDVRWEPELLRHDIVNPLSEILDHEMSPIVDLVHLRKICSRGIPDEPSWLRPRIWKLLLGTLPEKKASWKFEADKQRNAYYDLVRRLLGAIDALSPPHLPLVSSDELLLNVHRQLSSTSGEFFSRLAEDPERSPLSPLDNSANEDVKIFCAAALDSRWKALLRISDISASPQIPEICLEQENDTPAISLSNFDSEHYDQVTLVPSKVHEFGNAHPKHCSSLLRLLYLHTSVNPASNSRYTASILISLYIVLNQDIELEDIDHAEADTFWLFEAMVAAFSEVADEDERMALVQRFSERLALVDSELWDNMRMKGLDPALSDYSSQWLSSMFTHALPVPSVLPIWDVLFSCGAREKTVNPRVDLLLDISTAMLIHVREVLFRIGMSNNASPSLWIASSTIAPLASIPTSEQSELFVEALSILQMYPIKTAGGIDRILQTANYMMQVRMQKVKSAKSDKPSFGSRLKTTMWKGFTNQLSSPEDSESDEDTSNDASSLDGNDTETPPPVSISLTSKVANTVWKGITNATSSESTISPAGLFPPVVPPKPPLVSGHLREELDSLKSSSTHTSPPLQGGSNIWGYAEKVKDSDAMATLAKASSNWHAKALLSSWSLGTKPDSPSLLEERIARSESGIPRIQMAYDRRGSLPTTNTSPKFNSPRGTKDAGSPSPPMSPDHSPGSTESFISRTRTILSKVRSPSSAKAAPRPLLLNSSTLLTSSAKDLPGNQSSGATSIPDTKEWADVMKAKARHVHRESQSSMSSVSLSDIHPHTSKLNRSDWDSDTSGSSRLVPLNRRSVSPMAPNFRLTHTRPANSSISSSEGGLLSPPHSSRSAISEPDILPKSAPEWVIKDASKVIPVNIEHISRQNQQRTFVSNEAEKVSPEPSLATRRSTRKRVPSSSPLPEMETSDSSVASEPARSARVRSKRYPQRPANLQIQHDIVEHRYFTEKKTISPSTLTVEWPIHDQEAVPTPKASGFAAEVNDSSPVSSRSPRRLRKASTETISPQISSRDVHSIQLRKTSSGRPRKTLAEENDLPMPLADSGAEEGDDEGYDDLLSAYESEEPEGSRL